VCPEGCGPIALVIVAQCAFLSIKRVGVRITPAFLDAYGART